MSVRQCCLFCFLFCFQPCVVNVLPDKWWTSVQFMSVRQCFFVFFVVVFLGVFFLVGGIWGEGLGFSYFFLVKIFPVLILLLNMLRGSLKF